MIMRHRQIFRKDRLALLCGLVIAVTVSGHGGVIDPAFVQPRGETVISPWSARVIGGSTRDGVVKIWVFFTDKGFFDQRGFVEAAAYRVGLTPKATARRAKVGRAQILFTDVPLREVYIDRVIDLGGTLRQRSRWLNAASFEFPVENLPTLGEMPFVREIRPVIGFRKDPVVIDPPAVPDATMQPAPPGVQSAGAPLNYGPSFGQINQINVIPAHENNFRGQGVLVCMMDTGFRKDHTAFAAAYAEGRVLAEHDFIFNDGNTQDEPNDQPGQHSHGTLTWSTLGGATDGKLYGPAFMASFILAKTEDVRSETQIEEDNWLAGMEWADSIGADVISSSLGYSNWYTYPDFDGNTAVTTIAADSAAALGIVVCNSMGNSGPGAGTLSAPADADSILSVGAVNSFGTIASFSSRGPTADGRTKPEVCAQGVSTSCASATNPGVFTTASGTSLSCPLIGGAAAVVLSAHPDWTPMQVREALMMTASQSQAPNNTYGSGIVDVYAAIYYGACAPPAAPGAPVTSESNPCAVNNYTVSWNTVATATGYELSENSVLNYDGPDTAVVLTRPSGAFTYRVAAKSSCGTSGNGPTGAATTIADCGCHADPVCDNVIDVLDVTAIVDESFRGVPATVDGTCPHHISRSDVDCNCEVNVLDVVLTTNVAFRGADRATTLCSACLQPCP